MPLSKTTQGVRQLYTFMAGYGQVTIAQFYNWLDLKLYTNTAQQVPLALRKGNDYTAILQLIEGYGSKQIAMI